MAFTGRAGGRFQIRRLMNGETGPPGAGFFRITRTGPKPDRDAMGNNTAPAPTIAEFMPVANRLPVVGDIAVITYDSANSSGDLSCAFELSSITGTEPNLVYNWIIAAEFIDGNLVVAGSVFSNVGLGAGISVSELQTILQWDSTTDRIPELNPMATFRGGYMGFATNPQDTARTAQDPSTQILLVGNENDHIFWNGETLTLSGVTIEDPNILIQPSFPPGVQAWAPATMYTEGDVVTYVGTDGMTRLYAALVTHTSVAAQPPEGNTTQWQVIETVTPAVTVSVDTPTTGTHGDLWYDTSIGRMFLFYAFDPVNANSYNTGTMNPETIGTWADITKN